ncbi:NinG-like recombination protein [Pseudomonas phage AH02]|nr:NinG-like recombination protein [Pseudomonas phage AH02]
MISARKPKKCSQCGESFIPGRMGQAVCGPKCALAAAPTYREKAQKAIDRENDKKHRQAKEKIKTKAEHTKEAQQAFNAWIRARDTHLACVSCGRHHQGQYHAGHFRTVGANPELRFEPLNCHKQCAPCNNHKSGDIVNYRLELVRRIGAEAVEWLEGKHEPKRYTIEDLQTIKAHYRKLLREIPVVS